MASAEQSEAAQSVWQWLGYASLTLPLLSQRRWANLTKLAESASFVKLPEHRKQQAVDRLLAQPEESLIDYSNQRVLTDVS